MYRNTDSIFWVLRRTLHVLPNIVPCRTLFKSYEPDLLSLTGNTRFYDEANNKLFSYKEKFWGEPVLEEKSLKLFYELLMDETGPHIYPVYTYTLRKNGFLRGSSWVLCTIVG